MKYEKRRYLEDVYIHVYMIYLYVHNMPLFNVLSFFKTIFKVMLVWYIMYRFENNDSDET